jgi:2-phosphosulfolactate phosphatase
MNIEVALLPRDVPVDLSGRSVVVFDVLRATTTMTAALAAGVAEIRVFEQLDDAAAAAKAFTGPRVLCGEHRCLPPPGFDLGNSPAHFTADHRGAVAFMCTTNGTRAIAAVVRNGTSTIIGSMLNRSSVAHVLQALGRDVLLVCAGTDGAISLEDAIGAGSVIDALDASKINLVGDAARLAVTSFQAARHDLAAALGDAQGGRNVIAAGLPQDIDFAARLDVFDVVGIASGEPLTVRAAHATV